MTPEVAIAADWLGDRAQRQVPLGPRTTYRVGGRASLFVELRSDDDLRRVAAAVQASGVEVLVVGKGSNMLVADDGFDGLALALGDPYAEIELGDLVRAGAAASLPVVARATVRAGYTGFEWAVGVPGSIGGAVRMNAGGHGSEMVEVVERVGLFDLRTGEQQVLAVDELGLGYRCSKIEPYQLVLWAELRLAAGDRAAGERQLSEIVAWRRAHQPGGQNAGSVFANPSGDAAGRLIDATGCKGLRVGTAEVSAKHANFFQADAGGSADDIWALMRLVRDRVYAATGVVLHPETRLIGFPPLEPPSGSHG